MSDLLNGVHKAFIGFTKRAEKSTEEILYTTFVDSEPLFDILSARNSQVIYGRRGTGKTHALKYLSIFLKDKNINSVYIDLRSVGSDGALYHDIARPIAERSVRLILDVLGVVADELYAIACELISDAPHPDQITDRIDDLYKAISDVRIVGDYRFNWQERQELEAKNDHSGNLGIVQDGVSLTATANASLLNANRQMQTCETSGSVSGKPNFHIEFGRVQGTFRTLLAVLGEPDIWILIDEWSEVPLDLQPYLADLLRRTIIPIDNFIIKLAAIEHRSRFSVHKLGGEYIGLELGADLSADLNLDDFLVFDNDQEKAVEFFRKLLFNHYKAVAGNSSLEGPDQLIKLVFTQANVFQEFVRAVEGVPRDALNLAAKVATKAYGKTIAISDVRNAARDWYQQDKASAIRANPTLDRTLSHLIDKVIGQRRARAFLFSSNIRNEIVDRLFDARVLHLLKRNISSNEEPGKRYDVFKIDYGCYVDLINTQKAPQGLFEADDDGYVDVPADDYRSIRRAILRPEDLQNFAGDSSNS